MQALLDVILPVFLVVGFGYVVVWRKVFSTAAVDGLMSYTQNFAIPCLLFMALIKIDLGQAYSFRLMGSYYIGAASGFALGFLGARYIFKRSAEDSVAIGFVSLFSNSVMMGLAITERAYGVDALVANFAIVSLHAPFCYFVGITAMEIAKSDGDSIAQVALERGQIHDEECAVHRDFAGPICQYCRCCFAQGVFGWHKHGGNNRATRRAVWHGRCFISISPRG